jgi:hypothetical protein
MKLGHYTANIFLWKENPIKKSINYISYFQMIFAEVFAEGSQLQIPPKGLSFSAAHKCFFLRKGELQPSHRYFSPLSSTIVQPSPGYFKPSFWPSSPLPDCTAQISSHY